MRQREDESVATVGALMRALRPGPLPHQANPGSRRRWQVGFKMAGNQRQNLEARLDRVHDLSGRPSWRAFATFFIGIADQAEPHAAIC